jgi:formyltetrahydrofolate synthetase
VTDACNCYTLNIYFVTYFLKISMMPGLGTRPNIYDMDIDADTGEIDGLF